MFETVKSVWYMVKVYFETKPIFRRARKMPEKDSWQVGYDYLYVHTAELMKQTGSRIVFHGLENIPERKDWETGILFVGNHQSYFDIPVLLSVMERPTAFVAKKELSHVPFVGGMMRCIGCVLINRKDLRQSMDAIKVTSERLEKGLNMIIFPEGTRSKSEEMGEFKKGSIKAATNIGASIVPFRISHLADVFEANKGFKIVPRQVDIYFGEPIETSEMSKKDQRFLADHMKEIVQSLH